MTVEDWECGTRPKTNQTKVQRSDDNKNGPLKITVSYEQK